MWVCGARLGAGQRNGGVWVHGARADVAGGSDAEKKWGSAIPFVYIPYLRNKYFHFLKPRSDSVVNNLGGL